MSCVHSLILIRNLSSSCRLCNQCLNAADPPRANLESLEQVFGDGAGEGATFATLLVPGKPGAAEPEIRVERQRDDERYG